MICIGVIPASTAALAVIVDGTPALVMHYNGEDFGALREILGRFRPLGHSEVAERHMGILHASGADNEASVTAWSRGACFATASCAALSLGFIPDKVIESNVRSRAKAWRSAKVPATQRIGNEWMRSVVCHWPDWWKSGPAEARDSECCRALCVATVVWERWEAK